MGSQALLQGIFLIQGTNQVSCTVGDFFLSEPLKILQWGDFPGLSALAQCYQKGSYKSKRRGRVRCDGGNRGRHAGIAGIEHRERGHKPGNAGDL